MWKVIADVWEDINKNKKQLDNHCEFNAGFFVFADITDILSTFTKTDFDKIGK